ncbi:MAG TPA: glycoside hydrolase family 15 protein [bacterium]|nr:glycoside hydrolase family 15 protein [bacterium]
MYPYGLIGNAQASALVSDQGSVDWLCLPRPDSEPVFGRLLDPEGGAFFIRPAGPFQSRQAYVPNTNLLTTRFDCPDGSAFQITDFFPRFAQYGRVYRPMALFRIVEPLAGQPRLRAQATPVDGWSKRPLRSSRGNSHLRFERGPDHLRLATNAPLTYLDEGTAFGLHEPLYFALTFNSGLEDDLGTVSRDFELKTRRYWENWVKHCNVPVRYQDAVIRSALTLKLHCYEDTGAILAGLSTSLPESIGGPRNWDYRFCWLRDACFTLSAFQRLGHFEEMEGFLQYLLDLAHRTEERLAPVYRLDRSLPLPELSHEAWAGWWDSKPVRSGNQAAEHVQNDVYGEMILTLGPLMLDQRFASLRKADHQDLIKGLVARCLEAIGQTDAGPWELRGGWRRHAFSHLLLWAGLDRAARLGQRGLMVGPALDLQQGMARARAELKAATVDGALGAAVGEADADASLLLAPVLGYPDMDLCRATVMKIRNDLKAGEGPEGFLYRYRHADDFGRPQSAFVVCSFWLVQALAKLGDLEGARRAMDEALRSSNALGLLAEHFDPATGAQLGNFPQAYSHVGVINAAFSVSEPWDEVL